MLPYSRPASFVTPSSDQEDIELGFQTINYLDSARQTRSERQREPSEDTQVEKDEAVAVVEVEDLEPRGTLQDRKHQRTTGASASNHSITNLEAAISHRITLLTHTFISSRPRLNRVVTYLQGPSPPIVEQSLKPFFPRIEGFFSRLFSPIHRYRIITLPVFLIAWFLGFTFLVRASYFNSNTSAGSPSWIAGDNSFWAADAGCGINGTYCLPFSNSSLLFRCPAQTLDIQLLNDRAVGPDEIIFQPLVVGGLDSLNTYRADSWICPAAIQHGLFGNTEGGCGKLQQVGAFTGYVGGSKNGVKSVGFESAFPSSYRFVEGVSQVDCQDIRNDILGFDVAMMTIFSFIIRPPASVFFWVILCAGFWHVVLVSDPTATPPNVSTGFGYFLPTIFIGLAFWKFSWRWVVPAFENAVLEKTIWYLGGFWVGLLINVSLSWIPISRLTPHDIKQEPGGLVAVVVLAIFLFLVIVNQLRVIRRTGWFFHYLFWYIVGAVVFGLLLALPGLQFRLHHYFAAMVLMPGCAFVTRPSALFQGFLLGMFLDGAGRWGFDSILQTAAELVGDGATGSPLPIFLTNATNFAAGQTLVTWEAIEGTLVGQWDGFALIVDDVLAWTGTATNFSMAALDQTIPHYLRLAYQLSGSTGDFTKAATAFISNGTWIDAAAGPG